MWTFLWGSEQRNKETSKETQPTIIQDILTYKVKASEVSPFEYVIVNSIEKLEATTKFLQKQQLIALDCEGVGLSREGKLCLAQIATDNVVFLVDVLALGDKTFSLGISFL